MRPPIASEGSAPEDAGATLHRFRRRLVVRAAWTLVAAAVAYGLLLLWSFPRTSLSEDIRFARSPQGVGVGSVIEEGPVSVLVLEAKRIDEDVAALRLLVTAKGLGAREQLVVGLLSGVVEVNEGLEPERGVTGPGDPPPPPPRIGIYLLTEVAPDKIEVLLTFEPGTERLSFDVGAASPPPATARPPGRPPPPPPVYGTLEGEGARVLSTVHVDLPGIGVPRSIWR